MADPFTPQQVNQLTKEEVAALLALDSGIAKRSPLLSKAIDKFGWDLLTPGFADKPHKDAAIQNVALMNSLTTKLGKNLVQKVLSKEPEAPTTTSTLPNALGQVPTQGQVADTGSDTYKSTVYADPVSQGKYTRPASLSNSDIQYLFNVGIVGDVSELGNLAIAERTKQWRATHPGVSETEMPTDLRAVENPMGVRLYYDQAPRAGSDVFGAPGSTPQGFVGHGRVDKLESDTVSRTKSIRETLALLNSKGPDEVKAMQQHLVAGGFLDRDAVRQNAVAWGDPNDIHTRAAWQALVRASLNDRTRSMMQILQESESALAPHLADYLDPTGGSGGTSVTIALTDPASIRLMTNQLSQNLIGRKLDEVEQAQLVQKIHDMELTQGMGRAGKGNKVVNQVDPQAQLTEAIRGRHPDEAGAADVANEFTMFNRLVKGTLPSEGGF